MKKITPAIYIFSFFIAVVVMYWLMMEEGATHEQALINALAGGIGMLIGLFLYSKFLKKDGDEDRMPD